jgi:hypothetical protein
MRLLKLPGVPGKGTLPDALGLAICQAHRGRVRFAALARRTRCAARSMAQYTAGRTY